MSNPRNEAQTLIRELLLGKACQVITGADCSADYEIGHKFAFDTLLSNATARAVVERIFEKVCHIDIQAVLEYGPFEVVYMAKGALNDAICRDKDGDHIAIPSGLLKMIEKAEQGDFPPALPGLEEGHEGDSENTGGASLRQPYSGPTVDPENMQEGEQYRLVNIEAFHIFSDRIDITQPFTYQGRDERDKSFEVKFIGAKGPQWLHTTNVRGGMFQIVTLEDFEKHQESKAVSITEAALARASRSGKLN